MNGPTHSWRLNLKPLSRRARRRLHRRRSAGVVSRRSSRTLSRASVPSTFLTGSCPHPAEPFGSAVPLPEWERGSPSRDRDVRGVFGFHADDVVAGVDMMDLAGHPRSKI